MAMLVIIPGGNVSELVTTFLRAAFRAWGCEGPGRGSLVVGLYWSMVLSCAFCWAIMITPAPARSYLHIFACFHWMVSKWHVVHGQECTCMSESFFGDLLHCWQINTPFTWCKVIRILAPEVRDWYEHLVSFLSHNALWERELLNSCPQSPHIGVVLLEVESKRKINYYLS